MPVKTPIDFTPSFRKNESQNHSNISWYHARISLKKISSPRPTLDYSIWALAELDTALGAIPLSRARRDLRQTDTVKVEPLTITLETISIESDRE